MHWFQVSTETTPRKRNPMNSTNYLVSKGWNGTACPPSSRKNNIIKHSGLHVPRAGIAHNSTRRKPVFSKASMVSLLQNCWLLSQTFSSHRWTEFYFFGQVKALMPGSAWITRSSPQLTLYLAASVLGEWEPLLGHKGFWSSCSAEKVALC